jgi:hypothetical protein
MGNSYLPVAPKNNPSPPARQSAACKEDVIYISICPGGAIIKISAVDRSKFVLGTTHYPRRNLGCHFGRTDTLAGKLKHHRDLPFMPSGGVLVWVDERKDSAYRSGRSADWLKMKNPACSAVKREAEEDWGR